MGSTCGGLHRADCTHRGRLGPFSTPGFRVEHRDGSGPLVQNRLDAVRVAGHDFVLAICGLTRPVPALLLLCRGLVALRHPRARTRACVRRFPEERTTRVRPKEPREPAILWLQHFVALGNPVAPSPAHEVLIHP